MNNTLYQYYSARELSQLQELHRNGKLSWELHELMIRTPFFRSYSAEIEHIGFRTFYSQISIERMRKFTKPEGMSFVLLAGTLQDEEKEDVWVALFAKQVEDELARLKAQRAENEMLVFLSEMPQFAAFFVSGKRIDRELLYENRSKQFRKLLSCFSREVFQTRDVVFREGQSGASIYFVGEGQVELSAMVSWENNPTVGSIIMTELTEIQQKYNVQMAAERFTNLSMRVQIGILGKGQYFGDSEFLERRRRATQAKCLCDGTLLFRMDYNKMDLGDRSFRMLMGSLAGTQSSRGEWVNERVTECLVRHLHRLAEQKEADKKKERAKKKKEPEKPDSLERVTLPAYGQFNSNLHPNTENLSTLGRSKVSILRRVYKGKEKLDKMNFLDQISDPKGLGRYKNFEGASSRVANYIRSLSKNIQQNFIVDQRDEQRKVDFYRAQNELNNGMNRINDICVQEHFLTKEFPECVSRVPRRGWHNSEQVSPAKRAESMLDEISGFGFRHQERIHHSPSPVRKKFKRAFMTPTVRREEMIVVSSRKLMGGGGVGN